MWHQYYLGLSDPEKHGVWQEFYDYSNNLAISAKDEDLTEQILPEPRAPYAEETAQSKIKLKILKSKASGLKSSAIKKLPKEHRHAHSVLFGLSVGLVVVFILMFGFFNERFIAPFISPSKSVSSTPIIIDPNAIATTANDQRIVIPKINVEIPVVYEETSTEEKAIQTALERGVIHYGSTANPGERGNAVFFGHSSNNILNRGKYKFAFVLLNRLEVNDNFMLTYNSTRYVYRVKEKRIVNPKDFSVLGSGDTPTATLITCDPPGTSLNRLIVIGEQISPSTTTATVSSIQTGTSERPKVLPGNAPSLWQRIKDIF